MHEDLQWVEGELLALESLRQGERIGFLLSLPDLQVCLRRRFGKMAPSIYGRPEREKNQDDSQSTPRPPIKLFVD